MAETLFAIEPIEFRVAAPDSKKNRGQVLRYGDRYGYRPNPVALAQEEAIRAFLTRELWGECPHFGEDDVRVVVTHHARTDELIVRVEHVRPRPKKFAGRRRDLSNLLEVPLDAMQGPVYRNDNQVCEIQIVRSLD